MPDKKDQIQDEDNTKESSSTSESSVDRKNRDVLNGTPTATERVKPSSGDGLANEGTNVSYERER